MLNVAASIFILVAANSDPEPEPRMLDDVFAAVPEDGEQGMPANAKLFLDASTAISIVTMTQRVDGADQPLTDPVDVPLNATASIALVTGEGPAELHFEGHAFEDTTLSNARDLAFGRTADVDTDAPDASGEIELFGHETTTYECGLLDSIQWGCDPSIQDVELQIDIPAATDASRIAQYRISTTSEDAAGEVYVSTSTHLVPATALSATEQNYIALALLDDRAPDAEIQIDVRVWDVAGNQSDYAPLILSAGDYIIGGGGCQCVTTNGTVAPGFALMFVAFVLMRRRRRTGVLRVHR